MKLIKKWLIYLGCFFTLLLIAVFVLTKLYVTKNFVVEKIEESIDSRVQIGELRVGFFGTVELKNVIITKRDNNANDRTPHDDREVIEDGSLVLDSVDFKVSLIEILSSKVSIEKINIDGVKANVNILEDGSLDIDALFAKPQEDKSTANGEKFNAKENETLVTEIEEISITNADVDLFNKKTNLLIKGRGMYLKVSDIKVNPKKLDTVNDADLNVGGEIELFSVDRDMDYGKLGISGNTNLTLFNAENGDLEPDLEIDLIIAPKSYITSRVPLVSKIWHASDMLQIFTKKVRLPEHIEFRDNQKISIAYKLGRLRLKDAFAFQIRNWELEVMKESELQMGSGEHLIEAKLYIAQKVSKSVSGLMTKSKSINKILGAIAGSGKEGSWFEDGRLALHIISSGTLSDPIIRLKNDIASPIKGGLEMLLDKENRDDMKQGLDILKGFLR